MARYRTIRGTDGSRCNDRGVPVEQTVIVIEDEAGVADALESVLLAAGFGVIVAGTGERGLELIAENDLVVAVIDVTLPDMTGFDVCRRIGNRGSMPVLFLTSRDGELDPALAAELGADDYVTKPFPPREVAARVRAMLRRGRPTTALQTGAIAIGDEFEVDIAGRELRAHGQPVALATREFDLIAFFAQRQGVALSRQQLLDGVWGADWYGDERTVDVHVRQLRRKLGDDIALAAVWGVGYRLG